MKNKGDKKMVKVILNGCGGKMGHMVMDASKQFKDLEIIAGIDKFAEGTDSFKVFKCTNDVNIDYDVILDFSRADALDDLLALTEKTKKPLVLCSTGYTKEQLDLINEKSKTLPLFKSANMSLGINLINNLLKKVAPMLYGNYDIEIVEKQPGVGDGKPALEDIVGALFHPVRHFHTLRPGAVLVIEDTGDLRRQDGGGDVNIQCAGLPRCQGAEGGFELRLLAVVENSHGGHPC